MHIYITLRFYCHVVLSVIKGTEKTKLQFLLMEKYSVQKEYHFCTTDAQGLQCRTHFAKSRKINAGNVRELYSGAKQQYLVALTSLIQINEHNTDLHLVLLLLLQSLLQNYFAQKGLRNNFEIIVLSVMYFIRILVFRREKNLNIIYDQSTFHQQASPQEIFHLSKW